MKKSAVSGYLHDHLTDCRLVDDNHITGKLKFAPDFPGFAGHFPEYPLVPGVCLVETVRCVFENAAYRSGMIVVINRGV